VHQREKTPGQIVNEFEELLAIERTRAKERQGKRNDFADDTSGKDFTEVERSTYNARRDLGGVAIGWIRWH
jgi:hypothetical protein